MHILIIGGVQFMGREIARRLVSRGHDVTVLHRRDRHDLGPAVRNLQADRSDLDVMTALLSREHFEAVFDLAYDWEHGTPAGHVQVAARACGDRLRRYVFMSSIAAYGPGLDHRESEPLAPDDVPVPYVVHKASAERRLFHMHAETGFPAVTVRPPFVHGPRQPFYREQFFWDRLLADLPILLPEEGESIMQWAFVDDVAEVCVRALEVPEAAGEAFNIAHEPVTQREFVERLASVAGVTPRFVAVPRAAIGAAGGQLMGPNIYFGDYLDLPPHTEVVEKAPRILGVSPTPFDTALGATFEWYRTQPRRRLDDAFDQRLMAG